MNWSSIFSIIVVTVFLWFIYRRLPRRNSRIYASIPTIIPAQQPLQYNMNGPYPKEFLESQFPSPKNRKQQQYKDRYIGTFMNAGVIYDKEFLDKQNVQSIREPAAFTPYAQDYVHYVKRPDPKPFPSY